MSIKKAIKKILKLDPYANLTPLKNLIYIGSRKHGYYIPPNFFSPESLCYCVGAGTDISFDIELVLHFGCNVFIFDPMPYALHHYEEVIKKTMNNERFIIDFDKWTYEYKATPDCFKNISFQPIGIWKEEARVKFYEPSIEGYAGHSITNLQQSGNYIEAYVDRLPNVMRKLKHTKIDLLKMEIEGAEYIVIDTIAEDKPDIKIICVEFDEVFHAKNFNYLFNIKSSCDKLLDAGYKLVHSTEQFKRTFIRIDVYEHLKSLEM